MAAAAVICTSKCEVEIPKKLNKTQREALKKFEGTLEEETNESCKASQKLRTCSTAETENRIT